MSICVTTPTATQFGTVTTDSLSTTTSPSITTIPASITTIETSICTVVSSGVTGGCITTDIVSTLSPEQVITTELPVVVTVPVTLTTPTATLFGTSCDGESSSSAPPSSSSSSQESSTSLLPPTTSESVVASSSTLPGGSVIVIFSTSTAVITPTSVVPVSSRGSSTNLGAIIGGAVGGVAFVAAIFLFAYYCIRKRHKERDDDFDHVDGKINPFPIRLHKHSGKNGAAGMTIDDPNPFNPYTGNTSAFRPPHEGTASAAATLPTTSSVRRRTATMSDSFPNPYSAVPSSAEEYTRTGSPPAPTSDASVVSESVYSQQSRPPLHIANPSTYPPIGDMRTRVPAAFVEESDPASVYGASSEGGVSGPHAGASSAPFVHQDAGTVTGRPPRTKAEEARADGAREQAEAPPAYEA